MLWDLLVDNNSRGFEVNVSGLGRIIFGGKRDDKSVVREIEVVRDGIDQALIFSLGVGIISF